MNGTASESLTYRVQLKRAFILYSVLSGLTTQDQSFNTDFERLC